jgi:leucine dehydrogenase
LGLKAIIAIHSTVLGPALGGTRFWNYASEDEALFDVLRLSRGMSLKNAAAGLKHGGGKAVIIGDPKRLKSKEFFYAYGKFVDTLGGKYYTAEDVNICALDVAQINVATRFVTGTPEVSGNPSPFTARGVYMGMKAGASVKFGSGSLKGKTVAVQGLGSVGYMLCKHLQNEGANLKVYDINPVAVEKVVTELGATAVLADEILTTDCDILAPCALGAVLNRDNVKSLKCQLVAGAANNVLMDALTGDVLNDMDILYLPDYIINAGGVINCGMEITDGTYNVDIINAKVDKIYETTLKIIALAKEKQISTYQAADQYAENIIKTHKK